MYEARQNKEKVSRILKNNSPVCQLTLKIGDTLFGKNKLKKNYYKNILNFEADNNKINRQIVKREIISYINNDITYRFPSWRQAVISVIDTRTQMLNPIVSDVDSRYIINLGSVETISICGKKCIRAYLAVFKPSPDGTYKDITQDEYGKIVAHPKENDTFWINFGRPLRAVKWMEKYKSNRDSDPRLRSILIPFNVFENIAKKSIPEVYRSKNKNHPFNVDVHYEPNQFGLTSKELDYFNKNIIPYSLITYSYNASLNKKEGMDAQLSSLKELLGIPNSDDIFNVFTTKNGEFTKKEKFKTIADNLMWLFGMMENTYKNINSTAFFPKGKEKTPKAKWMNIITKMLPSIKKSEDINPKIIAEVSLWATQARISELMASDFDEDVNMMKQNA